MTITLPQIKEELKPLDFTPDYLIVDLFAGAGGTTTGFERAKINGKRIAKVIAAVNHDHTAIRSHWENHKDVYHFNEDIRSLDLTGLVRIVNYYRKLYPNAKLILWASLECTNFSKAKGGQPRDADSRTLANHLFRYISALKPDYIQIENVVEFRAWGPMRIALHSMNQVIDGQKVKCSNLKVVNVDEESGEFSYAYVPESTKCGRDWYAWRQAIKSMGYDDSWRELNAADFGAYTSRNRLFGVFYKKGDKAIWPEVTHAKDPYKAGGMFSPLKKWKAVREVLELDDHGTSIFNGKAPVDATLERIYAGLVKFTPGAEEFLIKYNSMSKKGVYHAPGTDSPSPVLSTQGRIGVVKTCFLSKQFSSGQQNIPIDGPSGSLTGVDKHNLVYLMKYFSGNPEDKVQSLERPCGTIKTKDSHSVVSCFLTTYNGSGENVSSADSPSPTLPTKDRVAPVFIVDTNFGNKANALENPLGTITASRHYHYLVNPSFQGHSYSIDNPSPVLIARQDKSPLYLFEVSTGNAFIPVYEGDSEIMIKIKVFMAAFGIADIKKRMLRIDEMKRIQGIGDDYVLKGTKAAQKKAIGNMVHPLVTEHWIKAMAEKNIA